MQVPLFSVGGLGCGATVTVLEAIRQPPPSTTEMRCYTTLRRAAAALAMRCDAMRCPRDMH